MTLLNIPTIQRINAFTAQYSKVEVKYFGSISYLMPLVNSIFGNEKAKKTSDFIDKLFKVKQSAFKFVLIAKV